jgi:hypothetical protein
MSKDYALTRLTEKLVSRSLLVRLVLRQQLASLLVLPQALASDESGG